MTINSSMRMKRLVIWLIATPNVITIWCKPFHVRMRRMARRTRSIRRMRRNVNLEPPEPCHVSWGVPRVMGSATCHGECKVRRAWQQEAGMSAGGGVTKRRRRCDEPLG